ncbi:glycosyltransferase family 2 protein [Nocardioides sp. SYSU D00065]|uniref:glycosyltransferase family 2 protein n=1 Tax=Nocardioides sp. SYSU D00065 TaxID=2817378 RepID=UPI001B300B38|nr:glycosyltransferase family 2 protein [Nocardioides sp. SYSU D00065]
MTAPRVHGTPSVSVVVCAYTEQRWLDLTAAIDALRGQSRPPDQVVLVVDHNGALLRRARSAWQPEVEVLANQESRGLSGARNTGAAAASGALVAFLDDDATPEPDWLAHLTAPFADPRVVAVGGAAVPRWDDARPRWWPAEFDWVVGCSYLGMPAGGGEVRNVHGAAMAFRADVFADGTSFSPAVGRIGAAPTGCEETELCIRIRQGRPDARIVFEPRAVVHHRVTADRERFGYFARRTFAEGRSKATVARLVGARDALSTERSYVARTLPAGVVEGLAATVRRGDPAGAARAGAIAAGLLLTAAGYAVGRTDALLPRRAPDQGEDDFLPVRLLQLELTDPSPPAPAPAYQRARVLVRCEGRPVGATDVALVEGRISPQDETRIRAAFATPPAAPVIPPWDAAEPDVTVVIATHDRPRQLRRCLESLLTGRPDLRVVVVDNAPSTSATQDMVRRDYPTVTYVREDVAGLARAHNRGLRHVATPVVAFTDDDVVVDRDWVASLARHFRDDRVGCVTGLIWPAELETPGQAMIEAHGGFGKGFTTRTFHLNGRPDDPLFPYAAGTLGSGANMAFRTDVLRGLGGFDPALGAGSRGRGGDDLAAFVDVIESGCTLVYEPAAIVYHHHRREATDARAQALNYGVGLAAYLTRVVARRPSRLLTFARLAPLGALHLARTSSAAGTSRGTGQPSQLLLWQLLGIARGPFDYARSVREARHIGSGTP